MSDRTTVDFLRDILEASNRIKAYSRGIGYDDFLADLKTQDAVVRNLEIIGEASKNLSNVFRAQYPQVPWKSLTGMRDKLIHDYFGVNLDIVWGVLKEDLGELTGQIEIILKNLEE
ncbi:MAG: DUF86 domain-containing protein [SAR324 cluster bacterium]|nr:DUF86 domain-containing protein [SAR324 cluster bacterium]